eukprot:TRINITY_DN15020_c0_g1_i1.p1 TRINITY_DN15020_c0_g1~~TRINITY_DN15020_c0_g1_i1.p1  ORF type:complete len:320 (-),score=37.72 TRINITY_DN15020_c0_g1_i1:141-1100(-)
MKFPIYIVKSEIKPLLKKKSDGKLTPTWLNETTIDSIVLYKDITTLVDPAQRLQRGAIYFGSSFNRLTIAGLTDDYIKRYTNILNTYGSIVIIFNFEDLHWVLLHVQNSTSLHVTGYLGSSPISPSSSSSYTSSSPSTSPIPGLVRASTPPPFGSEGLATLYDPMGASSIDGCLLTFASRLLKKEDELEKNSGMSLDELSERRISVRTQLGRFSKSFFRLVNVGIQLREEEGYNCGLYCALWARILTMNAADIDLNDFGELPKFTKKQLMQEREDWNYRLFHKPHFYNLESEFSKDEDAVVTKLLDGMSVSPKPSKVPT